MTCKGEVDYDMSVEALIKFTQGFTTDVAGRAVAGSISIPVDITNGDDTGVDFWEFTLLDVPPGSIISTGVKSSGASPTVSFTPDATGCYRWKLTVRNSTTGETDTDIRNFGAPNNRGWIIPSYQKNPDPIDISIKPDELNFTNQLRGWAGNGVEGLLVYILNDIFSNGFAGGIGTGYLTVQNEGIALIQQNTLNFVGPGVNASDDTIRTKIEVYEASAVQSGTINLTQDLAGTATLPQVVGLRTVDLHSSVSIPNNNDVLVYDSGLLAYKAAVQPGGDAVSLRSINLDAVTVGSPTTNNIITFDGTDYVAGPLNLSGGTAAVSGTLPVIRGGTGLGALGSANEILKVNALGTNLEYGFLANANVSAVAAIDTSKLALAPTNPGDDTKVAYASGGDILYASGITTDGTNLTVSGKLTVGGLIDPTGLVLDPQAASPGTGTLWVKTTVPTTIVFTNSVGTDTTLGAGGGGLTPPTNPGDDNAIPFALSGDLSYSTTWHLYGTQMDVWDDGSEIYCSGGEFTVRADTWMYVSGGVGEGVILQTSNGTIDLAKFTNTETKFYKPDINFDTTAGTMFIDFDPLTAPTGAPQFGIPNSIYMQAQHAGAGGGAGGEIVFTAGNGNGGQGGFCQLKASSTGTTPGFVRLSVGATNVFEVGGSAGANSIGFYGTTPVTKPTVSGSRSGNAALASLLTALSGQGLLTDSTTA